LVALHSLVSETREGDEKRTTFIRDCSRITVTAYENSFASRLFGFSQPALSKQHPPYIRREYGLYPLGLQFLQEIAIVSRNKCNEILGSSSLVRPASPIDFLALSHLHVSQANALLQQLFWPGITIADCIEFKRGIVALYRKLVVGVGVITSDGYLMYLAVRPHWQGEGIGRTMLWWLIKENENVDITLHVAVDNPALVELPVSLLTVDPVSIDWIQGRGIHCELLRQIL